MLASVTAGLDIAMIGRRDVQTVRDEPPETYPQVCIVVDLAPRLDDAARDLGDQLDPGLIGESQTGSIHELIPDPMGLRFAGQQKADVPEQADHVLSVELQQTPYVQVDLAGPDAVGGGSRRDLDPGQDAKAKGLLTRVQGPKFQARPQVPKAAEPSISRDQLGIEKADRTALGVDVILGQDVPGGLGLEPVRDSKAKPDPVVGLVDVQGIPVQVVVHDPEPETALWNRLTG
jgi:hypothetical protein